MAVSNVLDREIKPTAKGPRQRTQQLMLDTATRMMQEGQTPSVTGVAEAAGVSRATAYRAFPSQAALVGAVVDHGLGPILSWQSDAGDAETRVVQLLETSMPRIFEFEATFKAALKLTLEQWAERQAGQGSDEPAFRRGHRVELLQRAIAPLRKELTRTEFARLARALSLVYGLEVLIVLKDIWGLHLAEVQSVVSWAGRALVRAAIAEAHAGSAKGKRGGRPAVR
ncbi:MAG: TetR/AcrR family transcriptional regulator [Devosia sp.]|nr:TetR/AcrR family transcriptional regulator [Devosia sp.]